MAPLEQSRRQSRAARVLDSLTITDRERFERLAWFTQVRWVFGFFCVMALLISRHGFGVNYRTAEGEVTTMPAVIVVGIIFLYNALFIFLTHILKTRRVPTRRIIVGMTLAQIAADLIAVAALAHNTGGVENWYIILVLVPIAIASVLLPQWLAYITAAGAAVLLNTLAWLEQQGVLRHVHVYLVGQGVSTGADRYADAVYVFHVTSALTVAIFALTYVCGAIAARLRQRERQLGVAYSRLHEADETKSFFMRKASHELRAPLGAIESMLSTIALTGGNLTEDQKRMFKRVQHRTHGLIGLVKDLHRYSLLRSTEHVVRREVVRLEELVANTCELFGERARDEGVVLSCHTRVVSITGDEELLREMVTTLVANAVQYTPAGGRIDVSLDDADGRAVLRVADTGIGISEKARAHIFDEFYRATEAKEMFVEGTGLGLAIAKRVVEMHGGGINAAANTPKGTLFTVSLPAGQA